MTTFSDDFNRADSTTVGNGWVEVAEDWSIVSNRLAPSSTGGAGIIRCGTAMATDDNSAQVTIAVAAAVSCGVWCRGDTVFGNGYLWRNDGTSWDLFRNVSGSFTSLATFAGAAVNGDVAKIQAVGTTIKAFVNGVERASVTDSSIATGKNTGMRCSASSTVRYADFAAADVGAGSNVTGTASGTLGGLTATASGTPTVRATVAAVLGALTATASGVPAVHGVAAANLGGLSATASGTPAVQATATAALGGLTAHANATPTVAGTAPAALGGLTAHADATPTVVATAAAQLGALVGTVAGTSTVLAVAHAVLGALQATATGTGTTPRGAHALLGVLIATATGHVIVAATALAALGSLHATALVSAAPPPPPPQSGGGSWYGLLDILRDAALDRAQQRATRPVACPNDGEPLLTHNGVLYCPFDGWKAGV